MTEQIRLFVAGRWIARGTRDVMPVLNPATEETIAELVMASPDDLELALNAAAEGFEIWRRLAAAERACLLRKTATLIRERVDAISRTLTLEQGKTLTQAAGEVMMTAAYLDELAELGARICGRVLEREPSGVTRVVRYEPIGPVFAVSPWNLPAMMPGRKIGTALAAGCSIIVKPAKETPQTAYLLAACCQDAGIPDGVVNVLSGPSSVLSDTMISSKVIRKVSFTGSTEVGKTLAATAGAHMKKVTMELGGHAPVIVFDDVEVEGVVSALVSARHHNAGQSCMAATRFFVHERIHDEFVAKFSGAAAALRIGEGIDAATQMGPLTSARRVAVMQALVEDAVRTGASVETGGGRPDRPGYFFDPTVLSGLADSATVMSEEPFGPITPIVGFGDIEDVVARANATPYGLAGYVFSRDRAQAEFVASALDAGLVGINTTDIAGPTVPFGGVRDSGIGREGALEGILETMTTKTVSTRG